MTTTAHKLARAALGLPKGSVERGDLSLALAGAEAVDLLERGALTLDGDRIVPGLPVTTGDRLLDEAGAALDRAGHESVEDWLWRRGEGLAERYLADLAPVPPAAAPPGAGTAPRPTGDAALDGLLAVLGVGDTSAEEEADEDDAVSAVLAAVGEAVTQLEAQRLRRNIENDAFDNVWRGY